MIQNSSPVSRETPTTISGISPGRILLHVCCAPCSSGIIEVLLQEGFSPFIFFYNPNIAPIPEYEYRKKSVMAFAHKKGVPFLDADYDHDVWLGRVKGLEEEPERGRRCSVCFDMRLERSALYAFENKYPVFATTNGIGPWKDMDQVHQSGQRAAARYPGLVFLARNWRLNGGLERAKRISQEECFYRQLYCGCVFSLKKANEARKAKGLPSLEHGKTFYSLPRDA